MLLGPTIRERISSVDGLEGGETAIYCSVFPFEAFVTSPLDIDVQSMVFSPKSWARESTFLGRAIPESRDEVELYFI
jgi:hypothetical protein